MQIKIIAIKMLMFRKISFYIVFIQSNNQGYILPGNLWEGELHIFKLQVNKIRRKNENPSENQQTIE